MELITCQRSAQCFACDVIPVCTRFLVCQDGESIRQTYRPKVVNFALYDRGQTDSAVTRRSETDHIRLAIQFALGDVMIRHLPRDQCSSQSAAFDGDQFQIGGKSQAVERNARIRNLQRREGKSFPT